MRKSLFTIYDNVANGGRLNSANLGEMLLPNKSAWFFMLRVKTGKVVLQNLKKIKVI